MSVNPENVVNLEAITFWRFIASSISRLVATLDDLTDEELNWRPPAPTANSLYALAIHTLGNLEENILGTLCGQPVHRDREAEFHAAGKCPETVHDRWQTLRLKIEEELASCTSCDLDRRYQHPRRGEITGREILIVVARHAAEHLGQAELTRDLLRATQQRNSQSTIE